MVLYTFACTANVLMDLVTTYYMASYIMNGLGFRTYHGTKLEHVDNFPEHVEAYAIQRTLAENTFAYAWPSTFFIPFVLEPVMTIFLPLYLGKLFVRTHPEVKDIAAGECLASTVMDMGRYAD